MSSSATARLVAYRVPDADLVFENGDRAYILKFRDMPKEERPREKLLHGGAGALSVAELLAIVWGVGTKKEDVLAMANRALKEYGEKAIVHEKDPQKIAAALDIPIAKACQMIACFELGRRFFKQSNGRPEFLRTAKQVFEYVRPMAELPKEHLRGLYLDTHYRLVHDEVLSIGSLTANIVHPREVFRPALDNGAVAVILVHNHPSGIVKPSEADIAITAQLAEAGKILGIHLLDHIVVTRGAFTSIPTGNG